VALCPEWSPPSDVSAFRTASSKGWTYGCEMLIFDCAAIPANVQASRLEHYISSRHANCSQQHRAKSLILRTESMSRTIVPSARTSPRQFTREIAIGHRSRIASAFVLFLNQQDGLLLTVRGLKNGCFLDHAPFREPREIEKRCIDQLCPAVQDEVSQYLSCRWRMHDTMAAESVGEKETGYFGHRS